MHCGVWGGVDTVGLSVGLAATSGELAAGEDRAGSGSAAGVGASAAAAAAAAALMDQVLLGVVGEAAEGASCPADMKRLSGVPLRPVSSRGS